MDYALKNGKTIDIKVVQDHDSTAGPCSDLFEKIMKEQGKKMATISFSTGSSPLPFYKELVKRHKENSLSFSNVRAFLLDEYIGLPAGHPACFRSFMEENLYRHVNIEAENIFFFFGPMEDHMQTCYRFEKEIAAYGGVDLMILGIGTNGHIAFNEPGTQPESRTRMIKLTESTRQANARFFNSINDVPTHALSVGIANILESKNVLLIANGAGKADAIKKTFLGPVDNQVPASYLQNFKGNLTVVLDKKAATGLDL